MSPLRRSARAVVLLLIVPVLFATVTVPAFAQDAAPPPRTFVIRSIDVGCEGGTDPCWDIETFVARPGETIHVIVDFSTAAQPHDFTITDVAEIPTSPAIGGVHEGDVEFPENAERLDFFCSVHPTTMTGRITIESALGGAEELDVPHLGVNFLSYWVGLIAFLILFVVYGATFFLFKHNETSATTDQWDRPDAGEGRRRMGAGVASVFALVIAAVLLGAVVYLAKWS